MTEQFYPNTLPEKTAKLLEKLQSSSQEWLKTFYLSGGTALSLQLGHRESEDLDFFSEETFDPQEIEKELSQFGNLEGTELSKGTMNTFLEGVKLQFLRYPYPLLKPLIPWRATQLSSVLDIGCTKLQTIGMRGSKKDFIDLLFIFDQYSLPVLLESVREKYVNVSYSQTHILKSMLYFDEAEDQPMPRMHKDISFEDVKIKMIEAVKSISLQ